MEPLPAASPAAPPVVVVVVCTDPGVWFEECLSSLAAQDYPNLSVLVIDTASHSDPTPRVAAYLPRAFVRRSSATSFATAANEVLQMVEGASLYLFCHDDVALGADAVRIMVEEAFRSNAGIVGPKLVEWDDPSRLLAVGAAADRFGAVHPLVEPGELDQEQHDAVRDVFLVPSGATLIRADLFSALGGFDPSIDQVGEDLDLCWRAQVAGARVVVAPSARVRHLQAQVSGQRQGWDGPEAARRAAGLGEAHRLRSALICYGFLRLLWLVPLAVLSVVGEALVHLVRGRSGQARSSLGALRLVLRRPGSLWRSRRRIQGQRVIPDRELHRLQSRGSARLRVLLRSGLGGDARLAGLGSGEAAALVVGSEDDPHGVPLTEPLPADGASGAPQANGAAQGGWAAAGQPSLGGVQSAVVVAVVLVVILLIGSRSLFGHDIPTVGQLPDASGGVGSWWHQWWSAWRSQGLGTVGAGAPAAGLMALAGTLFLGAIGTLQHVVILGPLLVGPWGVWRVTRPLGSTRGRLVAVVVYAAVPVPYNALAQGRWAGVLMYAAAPWVLGSLAKASGQAPYAPVAPGHRRTVLDALRLGLLVALVGAFVPVAVLVVPVVGLALYGGCALSGRASAGARGAVVGVGAGVVALVALFPWSLRTFSSVSSLFGVSGGPASRLGLGQVLRFDSGPVGTGWWGWAILAAGGLALVIGGSWRLEWASRFWVVALVCWALTWMGTRGWLPVPVANPEVLLAPAAAALALAAGLGATAFEFDLPEYRFGWRQLATAIAGLAVVVSALPVLRAVGDGRWHIPTSAPAAALAPVGANGAAYRVLWIGSPSAIPAASWRLADGVGYATSLGSGTQLSDLWLPGQGSTALVATDVKLAERNETTQLGHLLAPMAVRYVVIPAATAPSGGGGHPVPTPAAVLAGLQLQTDLQPLITDPNYTIYQNTAWAPAAFLLPPAAAAAAGQPGAPDSLSRLRSLQSLDLQGSANLLPGVLKGSASGRVTGGGTLYVAVGRSNHLVLEVDGHQVTSHAAFGWATSFTLPSGGSLHVQVNAPGALRLGQIIELLLVGTALLVVAVDGRRRRASTAPALDASPGAPTSSGPPGFRGGRPGARTGERRPVSAPVGGFDEDLWADG